MLWKIDTLFGHVVEDRDGVTVYQDDGTPVTTESLRSCFGCAARCAGDGSHDPCIANLPGTRNACCGHGRELTPVHKNLSGYVALEDGRTFRFPGNIGAEAIKLATAAALAGEPLPDDFVWDEQRAWWNGLSDAQRQYVNERIRPAVARVVESVSGSPPEPGYLDDSAPWWGGLDDETKAEIWSRFPAMIEELREEALRNA